MPRSDVPYETNETDILHNTRVWAEWNNFSEQLNDILKLALEDEDIKSKKYLHAVEMRVFDHRTELIYL
jgi:hypothetical protein